MPPRKTSDLASPREALRVSEEHFRLLVDSVVDYAIFILDAQGVVATWNTGAERLKGYRADEIIGQHFSRFYPEEDVRRGRCESILQTATREGRFEEEGWRVRKDGVRFWASVVITALRNEKRELVGFAKVTRDLTERRRAEEERHRQGQLARERIAILAQLSEELSAALTTEEVGRAVTEQGMKFAHADTCTLYLMDRSTRAIHLLAQRGCDPALVEKIRKITEKSDNIVYPTVIGEGRSMWIEGPEEYERLVPSIAKMEIDGQRARAFWAVALVAEGETIGMLGAGFFAPRSFSAEERGFVASFARQCAQSLARAFRLEGERKAAATAESLRASLATTLRSIGDAVIATDRRGSITLMNGVAESLTGWMEAEAHGRPLSEVFCIVNERTRAVLESPVERVLKTAGVVGLANHTVLLSKDGREIPIDDSGAPIRAGDGAVEGVVLVFRDVTRRKHEESQRSFLADATEALSKSLDYESTVAKVARLAVPRLADWCTVDVAVDGERTPKRLATAHVDDAKLELAKELRGKHSPKEDSATGVARVLRTGKSELYKQITQEHLDAASLDEEGRRLAETLQLSSAMIVPLASGGRALGAMSFVYAESGRTYTEDDLRFAEELGRRCASAIENARLYASEQSARKSAEVANRSKDEFLAVVSHELRTPLNAIMGWAKMLAARDFDERRRQSAIETIERNAVAMAQLIEDLLDMSRVISGKMRLEVQQVELARIIESALESIRPAADAKEITLAGALERVPPTMGDPTRLQQIVWNLLSNAVKFSSKGGRVDVSLRAVESKVEIQVADNGKGIATAFLPNVFEAFRQEDQTSSRARGGLGLGLAITRQLVELHGGRIEADSEGEGRGAKFIVRLPIGAIAHHGSPKRVRDSNPQIELDRPEHLRGLRVLAVDDDDDARELVKTILEDCGCKVSAARSVKDALSQLATHLPDVLLSDIGMPGEDGYDLIRQVRALPRERGGDMPAAALTAFAHPQDRRRILNAGYSIHLSKPVEPAELIAVIATLSRFIPRR